MRWAVLLAGGSGTRFWPLSTPQHPEAAAPALRRRLDRRGGGRAAHRPDPARAHPGGDRRRRSRRQLQHALQLPAENYPGRAARRLHRTGAHLGHLGGAPPRPDAEVLSLHADWAVGDAAAFRRTADVALATARAPRPAGHRRHGADRGPRPATATSCPARRSTSDARTVARFSEKPDAATALDLMAAGALWNSGLFAWTADRLLAEVGAHTPEVAPPCPRSQARRRRRLLRDGHADLDRRRCAGAERRRRGGDGSLRLGRRRHLGGAGPGPPQGPERQRRRGPRLSCTNRSDCIVWSDGDPIVLCGVQDLVVVQANGRILVMPTERAAAMKQLLDALPPEIRDDCRR